MGEKFAQGASIVLDEAIFSFHYVVFVYAVKEHILEEFFDRLGCFDAFFGLDEGRDCMLLFLVVCTCGEGWICAL